MFIGCTAQENGGHGWVVGFKDNQFMNCLGESSSLENSLILKGTARTDEAANWYIGRNASGARLVSPRSANPKVGQRSSRYGVFIWRISWMILVLWPVHRVMPVMVIN